MKRAFDIAVSLVAFTVLLLPLLLIAAGIKLTSKGPVLYWSDRVGKDNAIFKMPKFRTMRPALYNQDDLIALRTARGIHRLVPGLTGWAQINGRDELPIPVKVEFDYYYLLHQSFRLDMKIILGTIMKVVFREGVTH